MDDKEIIAKAEDIAKRAKCDPMLNNPGGLEWHNQHGSLPTTPVLVGQPRPLARFDSLDNGWAALYRHVKETYGTGR